jgi:hypothetical protein
MCRTASTMPARSAPEHSHPLIEIVRFPAPGRGETDGVAHLVAAQWRRYW